MGSDTKATRAMLTVPNGLSVLRLLGLPLFLWLMLGPQADGWALLVLALSGFSDWLDGQLARAWGQTSRFGEILDPTADRLYILAVLAGLSIRDIVPIWFAVLLVSRDVLLVSTGPLLRRHGYGALPVHFLGKAATFALLYAFPLLLLGGGESTLSTLAKVVGWAFAIWGTALYWWAGALYVVQVGQLIRADRDEADHTSPTVASGENRSGEAPASREVHGADGETTADSGGSRTGDHPSAHSPPRGHAAEDSVRAVRQPAEHPADGGGYEGGHRG